MAGEVHLERCIKDLRERFACVDLEGASLKNDDYLAFNFNDYPSGMVF